MGATEKIRRVVARLTGHRPHHDCEGKAEAWKLLPPDNPLRQERERRSDARH